MNSAFPYKQGNMENENKEALNNGFYIKYISAAQDLKSCGT